MSDDCPPATLSSLSDDILVQCLRGLNDAADLHAASLACHRLCTLAAPGSPLWAALCRQRWGHPPHTHLFRTPDGQTDWRALYGEGCGWRRPQLACGPFFAGSSWDDELSAVDLVQPEGGGSEALAVASTCHLRLLRLGREGGAALQPAAGCALVQEGPSAHQKLSAVAVVDAAAGLVATGTCQGQLQVYRLPPSSSTRPGQPRLPHATLALPQTRAIVSQLSYLPASLSLLALHDSLAHLQPNAPRSRLTLTDAATLRAVASGTEVLDGYELAAVAAAVEGQAEVLAGSVKLSDEQLQGWPCARCHPGSHASLCYHQGSSSSAALCVFDPRAGAGMVQRFGLQKRSLYPHLLPLRQTYLATSHAGTPVVLWDLRQMSTPVHEVTHVSSTPAAFHPGGALSWWGPYGSSRSGSGSGSGGGGGSGREGASGLALPPPQDAAATQAMHLSAAGPGRAWLLGRQDNGMCWLWDLSHRLGWADGSHPGSWLPPAPAAAATSEGAGREQRAGGGGHIDETDWDPLPLPLGCLGAPYECWGRVPGPGEAPLHWLPAAPAWLAGPGLVALVGLELEEKQALFPAHAQGANAYPSNAVAVCSLERRAQQ